MQTKAITVTQIVPALPPDVDGIGDYALQLARRLRANHGVETYFIVGDPSWKGQEVEGFQAVSVHGRSAESLICALATMGRQSFGTQNSILLHFSPYGYQKRGYPAWLVDGLETLERAGSTKVNIHFHELDVSGAPPWSSAFWVPSLQRSLIRRLCRLSGFNVTNTESHRSRLDDLGAQEVALIPNFSTLQEAEIEPALSDRLRDLVVFGRAAQRSWTYEHGADALERVCRHLRVRTILDIGPPIAGDKRATIAGTPVVRCGVLTSAEVGMKMKCSIASFLHYPISLLGKSSVYAASCAHGLIPFVHQGGNPMNLRTELVNGRDFILVSPRHELPLDESLERLSSRIFRRYQARSSAAAAVNILALLNEKRYVARSF